MDSGGSFSLGQHEITFETPHPYSNSMKCASYEYQCPSNSSMRIYMKIDTESGYDYLYIKTGEKSTLDTISGSWKGGDYNWSDYYDTDDMKFVFTSDFIVTDWGVNISKIECFKEGITTTSITTTTSSTTTTLEGECSLAGDFPPCGEVELSEVIDFINEWVAGNATLSDVIKLINAWAAD